MKENETPKYKIDLLDVKQTSDIYWKVIFKQKSFLEFLSFRLKTSRLLILTKFLKYGYQFESGIPWNLCTYLIKKCRNEF